LRPSIKIYDGFVVVSSDLGVKAAEKGCDLMEPPTIDEETGEADEVDEDVEMGEIVEESDEAELNEDL
jgi:hypothetical protein